MALTGRRLIVAINLVAVWLSSCERRGLSHDKGVWVIPLHYISFGYDQGMMSGVNQSPDYVKTMGLGFSTFVQYRAVTAMTTES